jgi:hypothetical protein
VQKKDTLPGQELPGKFEIGSSKFETFGRFVPEPTSASTAFEPRLSKEVLKSGAAIALFAGTA